MGNQLFTNNAASTLALGINDTATTLTVGSGDGALFPSPTGDQYFYITVIDSSNNKEIMKCTARSSDTLTVTRAQEGTTARTFSTSDRVELRPTAAGLNNFLQNGPNSTPIEVSGTAGSDRRFLIETGGVARWGIGADSTAEAGSDAGSDFELVSYDDSGSELEQILTVTRSTGAIDVKQPINFSGTVDFDTIPTVAATRTLDAVDDGTVGIFGQTSAPTGWTKDTTNYNNYAIRVVTGTATPYTGGVDFTTAFSSWTLSASQLPNHTHSSGTLGGTTNTDTHNHDIPTGVGGTNSVSGQLYHATGSAANLSTDNDSHSHTLNITGSTGNPNGTTGTEIAQNVNYVDVIRATKDNT